MFFFILAALGSVASILALFLPAAERKQKALHVLYGLTVVVMTTIASHYYYRFSRVESVERGATRLIANRRERFTDAGFVQAALAFMEKNRDLYPGSYRRAQALCEQHRCLSSAYGEGSLKEFEHNSGMINAASAMEGLLVGISDISSVE
jgi:hypothetical protein